jgi:CBS domain containing-hemolysin-like protein
VTPDDVRLVVVALILVLGAGALAASEAAFARVSRSRAGELLAEGRRGSAALARVAADPAPLLSVSTFLRVLAESGAAVLLTVVYLDLAGSGWRAVIVAIATMTALSFVAVGVGPRTLGRQHADRVGLVAAPVMVALTRVLGPLARLLVLVGNLLTPGPGYRDGPFASEAELRELVDIAEESELIEAGERRMIHSVFELGDTLVREVMVPRTALVSIDAGTTLRSAMSLFLRSGFSRVPVVGEGLDDVRGILYLKDVARRLHEDPVRGPSEVVDAVMREPHFVPDSKPADDLLREMQRSAGHVAIVVDEYGGTAGMVTLEDLVEEIVGEIADEYDHEEPDVEELGGGVYRVPSRLHVEDLGELFGLDLDDEEVDTVGGLLAKALGRVPIAGVTAEVGGLVLTADRFGGRRNQLATVLVRRAEEEPEASQTQQPQASRVAAL